MARQSYETSVEKQKAHIRQRGSPVRYLIGSAPRIPSAAAVRDSAPIILADAFGNRLLLVGLTQSILY